MKKKLIYELMILLSLAFYLSTIPSATAASTEQDILQVATNFVKAWNTSDFELMSSLWVHSPKVSIFNPTKNEAFLIQGWEEIEKIWKRNFKPEFPKETYDMTFHNPQATMLGDNVAVITGYEILILNPPVTKEPVTTQGRSTYIVQKIDGKWLIVHGHVSFFPIE